MNEKVLRDLLRQTMAAEEPPIGRPIVGGAVRGARMARRRRLAAGITAAAAIVPALAFGVPAVAGALAPATPAGHGHGPLLAVGTHAKKKAPAKVTHHTAAPGMTFTFVRPRLPASIPEVNPVPITNQSLGQLLIDDLPAGAQMSQIEAGITLPGTQPGGAAAGGPEVANAWFNEVTTPIGSGTVQVNLLAAGSTPSDFGCAPNAPGPHPPCRVYRLPGGIQVQEQDMGLWFVTVFRPGVAYVGLSVDDQAMAAGSPTTKGFPLTMKQMLKIALDPRWGFTISQAFVQSASSLHVAPLNTSGD